MLPKKVVQEQTSPFQALDQELRERVDDSAGLQKSAHKLLSLCAVSYFPEGFFSELITAEKAFRSGAQHGIEFSKAAVAVNGLAERLHGPPYLSTNKEQIALFAKQLSSTMPFSFAAVTHNELSPVAAAFMALLVLHQKINNLDWQCAPDIWVAKTKSGPGHFRMEGRYVLKLRKTADEAAALQDRLGQIFKDSRTAREFLTLITVA